MGEGAGGPRASTVPRRLHRVAEWLGCRTHHRVGYAQLRRMSRDYEVLTETTEALIYVAMIRLMLRRLAKAPS